MNNTSRGPYGGVDRAGQSLPWVIEPRPSRRWPKQLGLILSVVAALGLVAFAALLVVFILGGGGGDGTLGAIASMIGGAGPLLMWVAVLPLVLLAAACGVAAYFYAKELRELDRFS